jgi:hypothetical protein
MQPNKPQLTFSRSTARHPLATAPVRGVHLNRAYRWFCRLGLDGDVRDCSIFSKNRHSRFRK